jgi:hypothetical protein
MPLCRDHSSDSSVPKVVRLLTRALKTKSTKYAASKRIDGLAIKESYEFRVRNYILLGMSRLMILLRSSDFASISDFAVALAAWRCVRVDSARSPPHWERPASWLATRLRVQTEKQARELPEKNRIQMVFGQPIVRTSV